MPEDKELFLDEENTVWRIMFKDCKCPTDVFTKCHVDGVLPDRIASIEFTNGLYCESGQSQMIITTENKRKTIYTLEDSAFDSTRHALDLGDGLGGYDGSFDDKDSVSFKPWESDTEEEEKESNKVIDVEVYG